MVEQKIGIIIEAKNRASKAFKEIEGNLDRAKKKTEAWNKKFENTFSAFKKGGAVLTGVGVSLGFVAKGWIDVAAEAEETQSQFDTVFAGMSEEMNKWADDFSGKTGQANKDIKGFAAGLGDVLKPMGLTTEEAAGMSKKMVELGLDVASFKGNIADAPAVLHAFKSALTGERESLKSYGIVISEADVKQEAYAAGLAKQGEELTKAAKTQATMNLLFKTTADAQGDLERTGGSYTNSVGKMNAAMTDFKAMLGTQLLPIITPLIQKFTALVQKFSALSPATKEVIAKVVLAAAAFALIGGPILLLIGFLPAIASGLAIVGGAFAFLLGPIGLVIAAVAAMAAIWATDFLGIRTMIEGWSEWLAQGLFDIVNWFSETWEAISTGISEFWTSFKDSIATFWAGIKDEVMLGLELLLLLLFPFLAAFYVDWASGWEKVKTVFVDIWDGIVNYFTKVYDKILGIVNKIKSAYKSVTSAVSSVGTSVSNFVTGETSERAFGGIVPAGKPVLVGERGPEVVSFPQTGKVTPNNQLGGGGTTVILQFHGNKFSSESEFRRMVQVAKEEFTREIELDALGSF